MCNGEDATKTAGDTTTNMNLARYNRWIKGMGKTKRIAPLNAYEKEKRRYIQNNVPSGRQLLQPEFFLALEINQACHIGWSKGLIFRSQALNGQRLF